MSKTISLGLALGMVLALAPGVMAEDAKNLDEAGVTVILADAIVMDQGVAKNSYWEPFTDIFGDGTIAVISGVHGLDDAGATIGDTMNAMVAFLRPGSTVFEEYWAFYDDAGNPYTGNFNTKRPSGNPPRIATDRRPGGVRYCVGQEATPWEFDAFTPDRWIDPFLFDERHGACQLFELTADGPSPITTVFDSLYGGIDGAQNGGHMRFGGDMRFLSNGNLMICPEDRSGFTIGGNAAVFAIYNGETGERITQPAVGNGNGQAKDIWSNMCAFDGGFLIRNSGTLTTFDNEGNVVLTLDLAAVSVVADMGRADDSRVASSINNHYVYIAGKDGQGDVWLTQIDAITGETVNEVMVNEEFFIDLGATGTYNTVDCAADDNGNVVVSWSATIGGAERDGLARIFNSSLEPVTPSFYVYTSHNSDFDGDLGFRAVEGNCSMDNERIVIAMNGFITDPATGDFTPAETTFVTVLESPFKVPVENWELH